MALILHFRKHLVSPPAAAVAPGFHVRTLQVSADVPKWLELRDCAMAGQLPAARPWSIADFRAEMTGNSWWRPDRSWVAVSDDTPGESVSFCGAVTLALREGAKQSVPVVHWLLVDPACRR